MSCSPVSNKAARDLLFGTPASEAADTSGLDSAGDTGLQDWCSVVFDESFEGGDGTSPPDGWRTVSTDSTSYAAEGEGSATLSAVEKSVWLHALGGPELELGAVPVRMLVDIERFTPGGDSAAGGFFLASDLERKDSFSVVFIADGHMKLLAHTRSSGSASEVALGVAMSPSDPPIQVELSINDEGVQVATDQGYDSGVISYPAFSNGFGPEVLSSVHPALYLANFENVGGSQLEVGRLRVEVGPGCGQEDGH